MVSTRHLIVDTNVGGSASGVKMACQAADGTRTLGLGCPLVALTPRRVVHRKSALTRSMSNGVMPSFIENIVSASRGD